jgi:hypothetical protein
MNNDIFVCSCGCRMAKQLRGKVSETTSIINCAQCGKEYDADDRVWVWFGELQK